MTKIKLVPKLFSMWKYASHLLFPDYDAHPVPFCAFVLYKLYLALYCSEKQKIVINQWLDEMKASCMSRLWINLQTPDAFWVILTSFVVIVSTPLQHPRQLLCIIPLQQYYFLSLLHMDKWHQTFSLPSSHLAPSFGVTPFEFMEKLYESWN